jgi:hypothetical protein
MSPSAPEHASRPFVPPHPSGPVGDPVALVLGKVEAARAGLIRYRVARALLVLGGCLLAGLTVLVGIDWAVELPNGIRLLGLGAVVAGAALWASRPWLRGGRGLPRTVAAAQVEARYRGLGQRVQTAVEYAEPSAGSAPARPGLVAALEADTAKRLQWVRPDHVPPWASLRWPTRALAVAAILCLALLWQDPERMTALGRVLGLPWYYSTLSVSPGDQTVKAGEALQIAAVVSGRPVKTARWLRRTAGSGDWIPAPLMPAGLAPDAPQLPQLVGSLTATLPYCQASLDYKVVAGAVESPVYHVRVIRPFVLKGLEVTAEAPAYTGQPPRKSTDGNPRVVEGSKVEFQVTLDREPGRAALECQAPGAKPDDAKLPPVALRIEGSQLTGTIESLEHPVDYKIVVGDADGMVLDPQRTYTIRVQTDEKPTLAFIRPPEELAVIPTTEIPIEVEASDDFGVARVGIVYQVNNGPKETLALDELKGRAATARLLTTLYLEKHPLDFTDSLTYHAFAEDNRPGKPNRTTTELRFIDILPFKQVYQKADGEGTSNGSSVTLGELIDRQRGNLNRTFVAADDVPAPADRVHRLGEVEQTLVEATTEFTQGLEARGGSVPPLHQAIDAMEAATRSLQAGDPVKAQTEEDAALAGLVKARQNLRRLLSESSTASQCRQFDRQRPQAFRKPPPKPQEGRKPQVAHDLKKLAEEERQVQQCMNPGSGGSKRSSSSSSSSPSQPTPAQPSREETARRQEEAAKAAEAIRQAMKTNPALSQLARERMDAASEAVRQATAALHEGHDREAGAKAGAAAERLEQLTEHVAALQSNELGTQLAAAKNLAQGLARQENDLAGRLARADASPPRAPGDDPMADPQAVGAHEQRGLAEGARTLGDWLDHFAESAADTSTDLVRALRRAARANPPAELAEAMEQTAATIDRGQPADAARSAATTAGRLDTLALALDDARKAFVRPKLEKLLAAENQAARADRALHAARDEAGKSAAEKALADLQTTLETLRRAEQESNSDTPGSSGEKGTKPGAGKAGGNLARAADALDTGLRTAGGWGGKNTTDPLNPQGAPVLVPPGAYTEGLTHAIQALQAEIQAIVLRDALESGDEAVPARYRDMVDSYYRALSEDLR